MVKRCGEDGAIIDGGEGVDGPLLRGLQSISI